LPGSLGQHGEAAMKVFALKPNVKKFIFHPLGRIRFNDAGEADWPMDPFTYRRIKDGDISLHRRSAGAEETEQREFGD